jgi:hypothetical protein
MRLRDLWPGGERDDFGRRVPSNFTITFEREVLADSLWQYDEVELAERAMRLSDEELHKVQRLAVWHHENDPDPTTGPKLSNARIIARAMIEYVERAPRDTRRVRRRTSRSRYTTGS